MPENTDPSKQSLIHDIMRRLLTKHQNAKAKYKQAEENIVVELQKYSELDLVSNDFAGDGLAIMVEYGKKTGITVEKCLEIIIERGVLTQDDFDKYTTM
jgi:hypothetical protein